MSLWEAVATVAVAVAVFVLVLSATVAFERGRDGGWRSLGSPRARPGLIVGLSVLFYMAALPFLVPLAGGVPATVLKFSPVVVAPAGAYFTAGRMAPGWSVLTSVAIVIGSIWVLGISTLKAYQWGWQGLDVRDIESDDLKAEFAVGASVVFGTALALLPAVVIGMLAGRAHRTREEHASRGV